MTETILLYNPISTSPGKQRLPMSLLAIAAMLGDDFDFELIDGNLVDDPAAHIAQRVATTGARLLGVTVMPGPQLQEAVPVCAALRHTCPDLTILWGGYFPSHHYDVTLQSGLVDYVIIGQGEIAFRRFVEAFYEDRSMDDVPSLAYCNDGELTLTPRAPVAPLENLPRYPYPRIDMEPYIASNYLGKRVIAHHSSWGCPFACNFCAIVELAKQRWSAESAERVVDTIRSLQDKHAIDGIEFHDMDFFVREDRSAAIAEGLMPLNVSWWGLGRVDTLMTYSDDTFEKLTASGCKMIFMGAEAGDDATLKMMNKGGKSGVEQTLAVAERMRQHGIVPEFSFVLGTPPDPVESVEQTIHFIREVKRVNPATELILYLYTPVADADNPLMQEAIANGFRFPQTLQEWASDEWAQKALRRNPGTPWSHDPIRRKVRDFESVINAFYPTVTDQRLTGAMRTLLKTISGWRYKMEFYAMPYELKLLQRMIQYRRPETTGF